MPHPLDDSGFHYLEAERLMRMALRQEPTDLDPRLAASMATTHALLSLVDMVAAHLPREQNRGPANALVGLVKRFLGG